MVNSITQSHCVHCGARWQTGCVIKTCCPKCEAEGHNSNMLDKCQKCSPIRWEPEAAMIRAGWHRHTCLRCQQIFVCEVEGCLLKHRNCPDCRRKKEPLTEAERIAEQMDFAERHGE